MRIVVFALAAALVAGCSGCSSTKTAAPAPAAPAAPVTKQSALPPEASSQSIAQALSAHKGQPILVNVFASWCIPCRRELPDIAQLQKDHPKLFVLGISVDDDKEALRQFLPTVPPGFALLHRPGGIGSVLPAFHLPDDWNQAMPPDWEQQIPITFVYDAKGAFATGSVGALSPEAIQAIAQIAQ